eukprot:5753749-Amphidinium_carterae.1
MVPQSDGSLALQEQHGPPSVQEWERCFVVLRTTLIQLKAASPANLDVYKDLVIQMATRYIPAVWMLVYQADVRMRLENFERIRRAAVLKAAMGGKSP